MSAPVIYTAVRGGVVQGMRWQKGRGTPNVIIVDYDDCEELQMHEEDFERSHLNGLTWSELEAVSTSIY